MIYKFSVIPGKESNFLEAWKNMTELIYQYEGSLGSRIHKSDSGEYIAYAQWPSKEIYDNSGDKLPKDVDVVRSAMREACSSIDAIYGLEVLEDLLKKHTSESQ